MKLLESRKRNLFNLSCFPIEFVCEECGKECRTKQNLIYHKYVHGEPTFKCSECSYSAKSPQVLQVHMRNFHDNKSETSTGSPLEGDIRSKHTCDECGRRFRTRQNLAQHKYVHGESIFKCSECFYTAKSPQLLLMHMRNVHVLVSHKKPTETSTGSFECYICGYKTTRLRSVRLHLTVKHPMEKCTICTEEVSSADTMHSCTGQSQLACEYCSSSFRSMGALIAHSSNDHSELKKPLYECDVCQKKFDMRIIIEAHRQTRHIACIKCNEIFDTKLLLKAHKSATHVNFSKSYIIIS